MARAPTTRRKETRAEPLWQSWRHVAAYVYLTICIFDFMAMPIFYEVVNPHTSAAKLVAVVQPLEPASQVPAMQILRDEREWEALTLSEGGLFHLAFGGILGAAAFTRGQEKTWKARGRDRDEFS